MRTRCTGMTVRHPPADVVGQTDIAIVATRRGGQIDRLPTVIVGAGVRPMRVVANVESPGAIQQRRLSAQLRWIRTAAPCQVGDHEDQGNKRRRDDDGDQPPLR